MTAPFPENAALRPVAFFTRLFWLWLILRTVVWILAVVTSHPNAPLDLVEWLSWGGVWQWGYCKHPPLPAWWADAASRVDPGRVWPVYVLSYSILAALLIAVWKLAREYLPAPLALAAAICQDGQMYFTNDGAEYSNNVVLNAGWAWLILCVHRAIFRRSLGWWIGVGVVLGLTALAKYTIAIPILVLVGFSITTRSTWHVWRTPGPYLAVGIAVIIFAPHAVWLVRHDFLPLRYAAERSSEGGGFERHITFPLQFIGGQLIQLLPVFLILLPMLTRRLRREPATPERRFLVWAILGPLAFLLLLSLTTGVLLREIWGSPLWAFAGIGYLVFFRRSDAEARLKLVGIAWAIIASALVLFCMGKQKIGPELTGRPERPHFPGRALADEVNRRWGQKYGGVPPIIGGEGWRAGNICCYSAHRPALYSSGKMDYLEMKPEDSPGTSDAEVNARGAVIVWDPQWLGGETLNELKVRFPGLEVQSEIELPYSAPGMQQVARTGVAFVPPQR